MTGRAAGEEAAAGRLPPVSVIVPARDARATLPATLESILAQDYGGEIEVVVADGSGTGATRELLSGRFPAVRRVANPDRTIAAGLNRALATARHRVIARCDAHSTLPPGYLARAVHTLLRTGAANVGGRVNPVGTTVFERAVGLATRSRLGAGDARYRIGGPEGPTDTVFPGVFRRDALEAAGGWDETLAANEDFALNWRLRERGGTVWFDPVLAADYRPRGNVRALGRQYFRYGWWKAAMLARNPRSLRARQVAAPLLVAALAGSGALAAAAALAPGPEAAAALGAAAATVPALYLLVVLGASAAIGLRRPGAAALLVPVVAATIHLAWGTGFLAGLARAAHSGGRAGRCVACRCGRSAAPGAAPAGRGVARGAAP